MQLPAPSIGPIILRRSAIEQGYSDAELATLLRTGAVTRLGHGAYLDPAAAATSGAYELYRHTIVATAARLVRPAVFSHGSAAALHGMPLPLDQMTTVQITRVPPAKTSRRPTVHCYVAELDDEEIVQIGGLSVTSAARTLVDLGRTLSFEPAVVAADDALHRRLVTTFDLVAAAGGWRGRRGHRALSRVVDFADGRSESVGETRSRIVLSRLGLPPIDLQVPVVDARGRVIARADFGIPSLRVYGEFDGRIKYGRLLKPGQDPGDVVFAEKVREDRVRDTDAEVVRWTWPELDMPRVIGDRWLRAIDRAVRRRGC